MHPAFHLEQLQLRSYKIFLLLLSLGIVTCLTGKTFFSFYHSRKAYQVLLEESKQLPKPLSPQNLEKTKIDTTSYASLSEELSKSLNRYQVLLPPESSTATPQQFQNQLQRDVSEIQEEATYNSVTLPSLFFLGLQTYREPPPSSQALNKAMKQEVILRWLAHQACGYPGTVLSQFSLEEESLGENQHPPLFSQYLGSLILSIRMEEESFQKFFNDIINSPYFIIIEKMTVENSNPAPPVHSLENSDKSIKILFGREKVLVTMKLRYFDFL